MQREYEEYKRKLREGSRYTKTSSPSPDQFSSNRPGNGERLLDYQVALLEIASRRPVSSYPASSTQSYFPAMPGAYPNPSDTTNTTSSFFGYSVHENTTEAHHSVRYPDYQNAEPPLPSDHKTSFALPPGLGPLPYRSEYPSPGQTYSSHMPNIDASKAEPYSSVPGDKYVPCEGDQEHAHGLSGLPRFSSPDKTNATAPSPLITRAGTLYKPLYTSFPFHPPTSGFGSPSAMVAPATFPKSNHSSSMIPPFVSDETEQDTFPPPILRTSTKNKRVHKNSSDTPSSNTSGLPAEHGGGIRPTSKNASTNAKQDPIDTINFKPSISDMDEDCHCSRCDLNRKPIRLLSHEILTTCTGNHKRKDIKQRPARTIKSLLMHPHNMDTFQDKVAKLNADCADRVRERNQKRRAFSGLTDEEMGVSDDQQQRRQAAIMEIEKADNVSPSIEERVNERLKTLNTQEKERSGDIATFATPVNVAARMEMEEKARKEKVLTRLRLEAFEKGMKARREEKIKIKEAIKEKEEEEKAKEDSKAKACEERFSRSSEQEANLRKTKVDLLENEASLRQAKVDLERAEKAERVMQAQVEEEARKAAVLDQKIDEIRDIMAKKRKDGMQIVDTAEIVEEEEQEEEEDLVDVDLHSEDAEEWDVMDGEMEELRREEGWMYIRK